MNSKITLHIQSRVARRYASAAKKLRNKFGGSSPTVEDLIHRELSHRTAAGIVEDFLESDWPAKKRHTAVARRKRAR